MFKQFLLQNNNEYLKTEFWVVIPINEIWRKITFLSGNLFLSEVKSSMLNSVASCVLFALRFFTSVQEKPKYNIATIFSVDSLNSEASLTTSLSEILDGNWKIWETTLKQTRPKVRLWLKFN